MDLLVSMVLGFLLVKVIQSSPNRYQFQQSFPMCTIRQYTHPLVSTIKASANPAISSFAFLFPLMENPSDSEMSMLCVHACMLMALFSVLRIVLVIGFRQLSRLLMQESDNSWIIEIYEERL